MTTHHHEETTTMRVPPSPDATTPTDRTPERRGNAVCPCGCARLGIPIPTPATGATVGAPDLDAIEARADDPQHVTFFSGATIKALTADVRRLTGSLEVVDQRLAEPIVRAGQAEDAIRMARLHIEAALAGRSRPLALATARAELAEDTLRLRSDALARVSREAEALRAQVAAVEAKRDEFAELVGRALPAIAALGAAEEVGDRWYGYGHGPDSIHDSASLPCGACDVLAEFRAALATTGEGK